MPKLGSRVKGQGSRKLINLFGFSLLELMLAIGLISIVTAVAIPNLRNFNSVQDVDLAVDKYLLALKSAQSSAISNIQCPNGELAVSWQVNLNLAANPDTYSIVGNCRAANGTLSTNTVLSAHPFAANADSSNKYSAITGCGANINASIIFTDTRVEYQCNSGTLTSGTITTSIPAGDTDARDVIVESGGVIRIQ